ncbi:DUF3846 domain-containing protein [Herbiconiux liangxiaofengii]|uniref:DUF3846 domain-containing protein n=1 Tax=Herbiconiux liangxiaofengii TaxID=3342795 RepID=UPI0035B77127
MPKAIVIPSDELNPPFEQTFEGLSQYQAAVGGFIEPIRLEKAKLTIFANEEGKLRGLPFNRRATALWWLLDPIAREVDELVGDVIILGAPAGASERDVPADLSNLILRPMVLRSEIRLADRLGWHRTELRFEDYFSAAVNALLYFRSDDAVTDIRVVVE